MVPPPFHGFEGITNKIVATMKQDENLEEQMKKWFNLAKPNPLNYHGASLNGNDCSAMMKHFHFLEHEEDAASWYQF